MSLCGITSFELRAAALPKDGTLRRLGARWVRLCRETEEVAEIQELTSQLESLVLEPWKTSPCRLLIVDNKLQGLYNLRNIFSLSAVLSELSFAGHRPQSVSHLFDFVDSEANYKRYRTSLHAEPSPPFLYPFIIDYTRGSRETLTAIFSFLSYQHHVEAFNYPAFKRCGWVRVSVRQGSL